MASTVMHVRLRCPDDSPACTAAQPLPAGEGCDDLDWWFSADARTTGVKRGPPGENAPALPEPCEALLGGGDDGAVSKHK